MIDDSGEVTKLWEDYENGLTYQASMGLSTNVPKFVRFYQGDQWPKPTKNTKNLPRPVINFIKMICRSKKSAILSALCRLVYEAEDSSVDVEKFNRFAAYICKEIGQDALDRKAVKDGVIKGSYFYHYYWDAEARGKDGIKEGALGCELIDVLSIFFANPTETDEQKQKWILIVTREDVDSVRAKCDSDVDKDSIVSDTFDSKYGTVEQEGDKLCTVLTRYFRRGGEVYFEKATKSVVINKPKALAPNLDEARKALGISEESEGAEDAPNNGLPDGDEGESLHPDNVRAYLYPIVVGNYEPREQSIYGLGEVEGLIPNQKAVNFNFAMSLLNAQEMAWGKYLVHPNALKGQSITNEPGQVLTDYSGTGVGIKKMSEQVLHGEPQKLAETLMQMTRSVTGASEVMTGEVVSSGMSGAAIAQLQSQAAQPIEDLKDSFWLVKEKQGKVLAQFFKLYYQDKEFTYKDEGTKLGPDGMPLFDKNGLPIKEEVSRTDVFSGGEFENVQFDVVVEAVSGTKSSAAGDITMLDALLAQGKISLKSYLKNYPDDAISNKSELLKAIEDDEQSEISQLSSQLKQCEAQMQEYSRVIQEQNATTDKVVSVIEENKRLRQLLASLYDESKTKLELANEQIRQGNAKIAETTADATDLASFIASEMSVGGENVASSMSAL